MTEFETATRAYQTATLASAKRRDVQHAETMAVYAERHEEVRVADAKRHEYVMAALSQRQ